MAPVTTKSGISALDSAFGGLYLKRATLLLGRHRSGKSTFAAHFLAKTLLSGENAVIFTAKTPAEVTALLDERGVDARQAIEGGQLVVCPYSAMTRSGDGPFAPLPFPQASEELAKLVIDNSISYAIFDSVVPWTAIEPLEKMRDHTEDFVASLEALKLTSLLLLPNPASPGAESLTNVLRDLCPTNIELESKRFGAEFVLRVTKYQGVTNIGLPWEKTLIMVPGEGFVAPEDGGALLAAEQAARQPAPSAHPPKSEKPKFRPLIQSGLSDFAGGAPTPASAQWQTPQTTKGTQGAEGSKGRGTRFKPLVAPSTDVFSATAAGGGGQSPGAPQGASLAAGHPESAAPHREAEPKPSFASVIDVSDFSSDPHKDPPPAQNRRPPAAAPAQGRRPAPVRVPLQGAQRSLLKPGFGFGVPQSAPTATPAQPMPPPQPKPPTPPAPPPQPKAPAPPAPPPKKGGNKPHPSNSDRPKMSFANVIE